MILLECLLRIELYSINFNSWIARMRKSEL